MDFRINSNIMGSKITIASNTYPEISIKVIAAGNISNIDVIKNSNLFYINKLCSTSNEEFTFVDSNVSGQATDFYYVRSYANGRWCWASPIWVTKDWFPTPTPTPLPTSTPTTSSSPETTATLIQSSI